MLATNDAGVSLKGFETVFKGDSVTPRCRVTD